MLCVFAYVTKDEAGFEASVPLLTHGRIRKSRNQSNDIHVFFMLGASKLSRQYRDKLEALGYRLHDVEGDMQPVLTRFPSIASLPPYYAYNYLRWILPRLLLESGKLSLPFICVDGDMIFLEDYVEIEKDVAGKTFILQGCPCFVSISNPQWFEIFDRSLVEFCRNPGKFNRHASQILKAPLRYDREYCNVRAYQTPMRHEQDFAEYLIAAGVLPQERTQDVFRGSPYYWVQNPLFMGDWAAEQEISATPRVREIGHSLMVSEKRIPFVHFQNDFAWYAHCWIRLHELGASWLAGSLRTHSPEGGVKLKSRILSKMLRELDPQSRAYTRAEIYGRVFARNPKTGSMYITDIMNSCWL